MATIVEQRRAQAAVSRAIAQGHLIPAPQCEHCSTKDSRILAHHYQGYHQLNHLHVQWLCDECHKEAHRQVAKEDVRNLRVVILVNRREYDTLTMAAHNVGLSTAEFVRQAINKSMPTGEANGN